MMEKQLKDKKCRPYSSCQNANPEPHGRYNKPCAKISDEQRRVLFSGCSSKLDRSFSLAVQAHPRHATATQNKLAVCVHWALNELISCD